MPLVNVPRVIATHAQDSCDALDIRIEQLARDLYTTAHERAVLSAHQALGQAAADARGGALKLTT